MKGKVHLWHGFALALFSLPVFWNLGELPIRVWDESRLAINAWEMYSGNSPLVLHFDGSPDMWNTKPPLMIWLQAASIGLFGLSEWSIRLPAALAAVITAFLLFLFCRRYLGSNWPGLMAGMILVTFDMYNGHHLARTGDFDALLILFLTLSSLALFAYAESSDGRLLALSTISFGFALATKGVASMLIVPGLAFYIFIRGRMAAALADRSLYVGAGFIAAVILVLYGGRELVNPGYLRAVFDNEIGGRYFEVNEGHVGGPLFYLEFLKKEYWLLFLPLALFPLMNGKGDRAFRLVVFSLVVPVFFLVFVSAAKTKLYWYIGPMFPFLAMAIGVSFHQVLIRLNRMVSLPPAGVKAVGVLLFCLLMIRPAGYTLDKVWSPEVYDYETWQYDASYFFRDCLDGEPDLSGYYFLRAQYQPHIDFYIISLADRGIDIRFGRLEDLKPGDKAVYWEDPVGEAVAARYETEAIPMNDVSGRVRAVEVLSPGME